MSRLIGDSTWSLHASQVPMISPNEPVKIHESNFHGKHEMIYEGLRLWGDSFVLGAPLPLLWEATIVLASSSYFVLLVLSSSFLFWSPTLLPLTTLAEGFSPPLWLVQLLLRLLLLLVCNWNSNLTYWGLHSCQCHSMFLVHNCIEMQSNLAQSTQSNDSTIKTTNNSLHSTQRPCIMRMSR